MEDKKTSLVNYHDLKNKLIYFVCFTLMLAILSSVYYVCFFRDIHIDLTQNLDIACIGENGSGILQTIRHDYNYNQRIEPFFEALSEDITNNGSLSNGDEVTVTVTYNEALAEQFHIVVSENKKTIIVEGLAQRYNNKDEITSAYLDSLMKESSTYLKKDQDRILREDFTLHKDVQYVNDQLVQQVFLKAEDSQEHDRIVFVYEINAVGKTEENIAQEESIYYMIVFDDVNSNMIMNDSQVYGEKALNTQEDLTSEEGIIRYFKNKYVLSYEVEVF